MNDVISQLVLKRATIIELPITGTVTAGSEYKFTSDLIDKVRNKQVYGIEFVTNVQLAVSPSNRPVIAQADAVNFTMTIVERSTNLRFIDRMPATRFIPSLYNGYTQFVKPRFVDFTQATFRVVAAGGITTAQSIILLVYFKDEKE